ncbi:MAG TPA: hypothetical protein VHL80_20095 [Polyangia bacterium]|nr:hypothetical protein [Polyangia bacterium]
MSRPILLAALALPVLVGLGASGCHTYKYVDSSVSFDQTVDDSDILAIHDCRVEVTGADTHSFLLIGCPPSPTIPDPHVGPSFEFSTFAESGTLHFEFKGFQGLVEKPECLLLDGKLDVPVTGATTIMAPPIVVTKAGPGCQNNVTPPTDGG